MKKLFSIIMCVLMVMCFMPSMAFAVNDITNANGVSSVTIKDANGTEQTIEAVSVTTESELNAAIEAGNNVVLGNDISLSGPITITQSLAIVGNGHKLTANYSGENTRAINIWDGSNITVTLSNLTVVGPTSGGYCRGISTGDTTNLTLVIDNCNISTLYYALNIVNDTNSKIIVRNSTLTGYCAFQTFASNTKATFVNCTLGGNNQWSGTSDDFAAIVVNEDAENCSLSFENCKRIEANEEGTANEYLFSIRDSSANVTVSGNGELEGKLMDPYCSGSTISITGGTFTANPKAYVTADSKVYLTETGKYQVNDATHTGNNNTWKLDEADGLYKESYVVKYGGSSSSGSSSSSSSSSSSTSGSSTSSGSTSAVVNTTETKTDTSATGSQTTTTTVPETKATVAAETKTAADGTKTTTATVDTTTANKIVEKAVENKSEEVVVATATTPVTETAAGTTTEVAIPAETVSQIAEKTAAAVTIESEAAKVTLDQQAVEAVAETAGETGTVNLVVETKAQDENKVEVELKLETSNGTVSNFKGGSVSVTVKLNSALAGKAVTCVYIDDNGNYHKVAGHKNADGTFTFMTGHFSTYAIMAVEEADAVIATQTENVTKLVNDLSLKARSSKTAKGSIKVNLTVDADEIQAIEDLGYTVKYKFYRSTKKSSAYKAKVEKDAKTYTNTAGKKGTRYFYKARVMVYDTEGTLIAKTALKQCKYASRTR